MELELLTNKILSNSDTLNEDRNIVFIIVNGIIDILEEKDVISFKKATLMRDQLRNRIKIAMAEESVKKILLPQILSLTDIIFSSLEVNNKKYEVNFPKKIVPEMEMHAYISQKSSYKKTSRRITSIDR